VIAAHRDELAGSEWLAAEHLAIWHRGETTAVTDGLSRALEQWEALGLGDRLVFEWPEATGTVVRVAAPAFGCP